MWKTARQEKLVKTNHQAMKGSNRGPIGGQNLGDFCFFLFVNGILMPFWDFNYSKMAKYRFLIDSNTFWMDFGTSKISDFLDP